MINLRRWALTVAALAIAAPLASAQAAAARSTVTQLPCSPPRVDLLTYHGGATAEFGDVYLIFWGAWWNSNTTQAPRAMDELKRLFTGIGGTAYANTLTQYCWYQSPGDPAFPPI